MPSASGDNETRQPASGVPAAEKNHQDPSQPEIRLAVVLNGGASLAVWMGGVAHEIDLLRRASRTARGEGQARVGPYDEQVNERWERLCRERPVGRVVVDVVSGTSAGGLNGTLLATAVARGVPLDGPASGPQASAGPWMRQLWTETASLQPGRLLPRQPPDPPSVLDGAYFTECIRQAVGEVGHRDDLKPDPEPVTLFVTATGLGTRHRRYEDSFGDRFDVPDHRHLYRFVRGETDGLRYAPPDDGSDGHTSPDQWWEPFTPDAFINPSGDGASATDDDAREAQEALVCAARASASFPLAFGPVEEIAALAKRRVRPPASLDLDVAQLLDGGILDNAPFTPVLDAITRRPLRGPVRRVLVYVVPSRGTAGATAPLEVPAPDWRSITGAVVGYPRETDLREDVERLEDLLLGGGETAAPEQLLAAYNDPAALEAAASALLASYRAARAVGGVADARRLLAAGGTRPVALAARSARPQPTAVPWLPVPGTERFDVYQTGAWAWGLGAAERVVRSMLRDLRSGGFTASGVSDAVRILDRELTRIEAVRDRVDEDLTRGAPQLAAADDAALIEHVADLLRHLAVPQALAGCVDRAADAYAAARGVEPAVAVRVGLAAEVCTEAFVGHRSFQRSAPFELLRLGPDVGTPAVAPLDAAVGSQGAGDAKLYGTRLMHFGAFGRPEWRRWDWLCGRLDAQAHLVRALLQPPTGDGPATELEVARWVTELQTATLEAELDSADGNVQAEFLRRLRRVRELTDGQLLDELRTSARGDDPVVGLADAAMRVVPKEQALGNVGVLANALLARSPQRPFGITHRRWTPIARLVTRRIWLRTLRGARKRRRKFVNR